MTEPRKPQDRKPRKRTGPTAAQRAQAEAEETDTGKWETTALGESGIEVRTLRFKHWPRHVYSHIQAGNFEAFAAVVHEDDVDAYASWDSTIGDLSEVALGKAIDGTIEVGEAVASRRSSTSMRLR
jgi:hypothetical protein